MTDLKTTFSEGVKISPKMAENANLTYTVTKIGNFPVPSRDVAKQTLPGREQFNYLVRDIPAEGGKIAILFYSNGN